MAEFDIAPIYMSEIQTFAERNRIGLSHIEHNLKYINRTHGQMPNSARIMKPIEELKRAGFSLPDTLYYMLYPEHVIDLTQSVSKAGIAVKNALRRSASLGNVSTPPMAEQEYKSMKAFLQFRNAVDPKIPNKNTLVSYDTEYFSGLDGNNNIKLYGIYDYSFSKFDRVGQASARYTNLIGITDGGEADKFLTGILNKVKRNQSLGDKSEIVTYDFISRLGASDVYKQENGRWASKLTDVSGINYKTTENFEKGINILRRIGADQGIVDIGNGLTLQGGYKTMVDDIVEVFDKNTIHFGHNIKLADIPAFRTMINTVPGMRQYLDSQLANKGLTFDDIFGENILAVDTLRAFRQLPKQVHNELVIKEIYPNGIQDPNAGPNQSETVYKHVTPEADRTIKEVHHGAFIDDRQQTRMAHIEKFASGEWATADPVGKSIEYLVKSYEKTDNDAVLESIEKAFSGDDQIYLQAFKGGSKYSLDNLNIAGFMETDTSIIDSGGIMVNKKFDQNGNVIGFTDAQNDFVPGIFVKNGVYRLDKNSFSEVTDKDFIRRFGNKFAGEDSLISFSMDLYQGEDLGYSRGNKQRTTIYIGKSQFERIFPETFGVIQSGDRLTKTGQTILNESYSVEAGADGKTKLTTYKNTSNALGLAKNQVEQRIAENASRSLEKGSYDSLMKGMAMRQLQRDIAMAGHGQITLTELGSAIRDAITNPQSTRLQNILSGLNLTGRQEATGVYGFNIYSVNAWKQAFTIDNTPGVNMGWFDNSLYLAKTVSENSFAGRLAYSLTTNKALDITTKKSIFKTAMGLATDYRLGNTTDIQAQKAILGLKQGRPRIGMNTFSLYMPNFIRSVSNEYLVDNTFGYIDLNLDDQYKSFNAIKRVFSNTGRNTLNSVSGGRAAAYTFLDALVGKRAETGVRNLFVDESNQDRNLALKEARDAIREIRDSETLSGQEMIDRALLQLRKVRTIWADEKSFGSALAVGFKETDNRIYANSSLFTDDLKEDASIVDNFIQQAQEIVTSKGKAKEDLQDFLTGGDKAFDQYMKSFDGLKINSDQWKIRRAMALEQFEAFKKYGSNLVDRLGEAGGSYRVTTNGRLLISFADTGASEYDITDLVPRLKTNGAAMYTQIGKSSWVTGFEAYDIDIASGKLKVGTTLGSMANVFLGGSDDSLLTKRIQENNITHDRNTADIFMSVFKKINERVRENGLAEGKLRDIRRNSYIGMSNLLRSEKGRESLKNIVDNLKSNKEFYNKPHIARLRKFLRDNENKKWYEIKYINSEVNDLIRAIEDGSVPSAFGLAKDENGIEFRLGTQVKDSAMAEAKFLMADTFYDGSAFDNPNKGVVHVQENAKTFSRDLIDENYLGRNYNENIYVDDQGVKRSARPVRMITDFQNTVEGNEINRIAVRRAEITTAGRDKLMAHAAYVLGEHNKNLETVQNVLGLRMLTMEGGGFINARLVEALGLAPGEVQITADINKLRNKDQIDTLQKGVSIVNGRYEFDDSKSYFVKKGRNIIDSYAAYGDTEVDNAAKRDSMVTAQFYRGNTRLSNKEISDMVYEYAKTHNKEISNADQFRQVADEFFSSQSGINKIERKFLATPVFIKGSIKGLTGEEEKNTYQTYLGTLNEIEDDEIRNFIKNNDDLFKVKINGEAVDLRTDALNKVIFEDVASGQFNLSIFDENRDKLRAAVNQFGSDRWKNILTTERTKISDIIVNKLIKADIATQAAATAAKHGTFSETARRTYEYILNTELAKGKSLKEASREAAFRMNGVVIDKDTMKAASLSVNDKGDLIIPNSDNIMLKMEKAFNALGVKDETEFYTKLSKGISTIRDENGNEIGRVYSDSLSLVDIAPNLNKKARFGQRELNALHNLIYDEDSVQIVRESLGDERKFMSLFGDVLDANGNLNKSLVGTSVWAPVTKQILADNFAHGYNENLPESGFKETLYNPKEVADSDRFTAAKKRQYQKIYESAKAELGEDTLVSKEFVEEEYRTISAYNAQRLNQGKVMGKDGRLRSMTSEERAKLIEEGDFKEYNILDIPQTPTNTGRYTKKFGNFWENNAKINLINDDLGLTEEFWTGGLKSTNTEIFIPGAKTATVGENISVTKEFQKKLSGMASDINKLQALYKNQTPENTSEVNKQAEEIRKRLKDKQYDILQELDRYTRGSKEGQAGHDLVNRRFSLSSQANVQVFDVESLINDKASPEMKRWTYNGQNLQEMYKRGKRPGFMVASTADLEKFGFTDEYFKNLGVNKDEWLERVKTEGINALGNRAPSDYLGSTRGVKLYFSDNLQSGYMAIDSVTSELMKADSDGDITRALAMSVKDQAGRDIDVISASMMSDLDEVTRNKVNTLNKNFERATLLAEEENQRAYELLESSKEYAKTVEQYYTGDGGVVSKQVKYYHERAVDNLINSYASKLDTSKRQALENRWNAAIETTSKLLSEAGKTDELENFINASKSAQMAQMNSYLKSGLYSEDARKSVISGAIAYQDMVAPLMSGLNKNLRLGTGKVDSPFFVLDTISNYLRTSPDIPESFRLTKHESDILNYLRESAKEGFLTPKQGGEQIIENVKLSVGSKQYGSVAEAMSGELDALFRSQSSASTNKALENLKYIMNTYGRDVGSRNIASKYDQYADLKDSKLHEKIIEDAVGVVQKVMDYIDPELKKGTFALRGVFGAMSIRNLEIAATDKSISNVALARNITARAMGATPVVETLLRSRESLVKNTAKARANTKVADAVKEASEGQTSGIINSIKAKIPRTFPKNWGTAGLAVAAGLMLGGYAGGNPAAPSGSEANSTANRKPLDNGYAPLPPLTDSSLSAMRGGPKQGYIININAQSDQGTKYASRVISSAVRNNYSNTQINVALNVNETQSNISSEGLYEYFASAI